MLGSLICYHLVDRTRLNYETRLDCIRLTCLLDCETEGMKDGIKLKKKSIKLKKSNKKIMKQHCLGNV